jgi:peptide/nickel transport system permease protein
MSTDSLSLPAGGQATRAHGRWRLRAAPVCLGIILFVAFIGPLLAPYSPIDTVGNALSGPSGSHLLGTDYLGRDVLSRVLAGGSSLVIMALAATLLTGLLGITVGCLAGFVGYVVDGVLMRLVDILIAFPPILLVLIVATGAPHNLTALVLTMGVVLFPGNARVVRTATLERATRSFVEAAVARGEGTFFILRREILPNIAKIIWADLGVRLTYSILLTATVSFFGLGISEPSPNWALMISENINSISLQPWAVFVPAALIAVLTVSVNACADLLAQSRGTGPRTGGLGVGALVR